MEAGELGKMEKFEHQYVQSLRRLLYSGTKIKNRTGIDCLKIPSQHFEVEDVKFDFPIIKGRKMFPHLPLIELFWMMNGKTDVKWLQDRKVKYWNEWAGADGTIGKSYGYQFRNFNGADPLRKLIDETLENPLSRRLILNLWNHADLNQMTLPPCFLLFQFDCTPFYYDNDTNMFEVDIHVTSRSEDSFLGQPTDFMFCAWFLNIYCEILNKLQTKKSFIPRHLFYTANNYHLYVNHTEQAEQYIANVQENKNNIINQRAVCDINILDFSSINTFLDQSDKTDYSGFFLKRTYTEEYGVIKAPIAV